MSYKKLSALLAVFVLADWAGTANAVVIGAPGNTNNCFPFGCDDGWIPVYQQVYGASEFAGAIDISSISFYQNSDFPTDLDPNLGTFTIQLSTTSASVDGLSSTAANNLGADNVTVFTGSLPAAPSSGGQWDILLDSVFSYNPASGNLLVSISATGLSQPSSNGLILYSQSDSADGMSRLFGSIRSSQGLVTGFNEAGPAPPPPAPPGAPSVAVPTLPVYGLVLTITGLLLAGSRNLRVVDSRRSSQIS